MLYIPQNSQEVKHSTGAAAYLYTNPRTGKPAAVGYNAGAIKNHAFHYSFRTAEQRQQYIDNWFANLTSREAQKAARRAENKTWHHGYKAGDILDGSWGYDQTNREFYQVIKVNPESNSIVIRALAHEAVPDTAGFMCCSVLPVKDNFIGPERRTIVKKHYREDKPGLCSVTVEINGKWDKDSTRVSLDLWDGHPSYSSWYA